MYLRYNFTTSQTLTQWLPSASSLSAIGVAASLARCHAADTPGMAGYSAVKALRAEARRPSSVLAQACLLQLLQQMSRADVVQANAVSLSAELPQIEGGTQKVLYPSSAKAGSDLQVHNGVRNSNPFFQCCMTCLNSATCLCTYCHPTSAARVLGRIDAILKVVLISTI